ncbi:MAG: aldo/keto reductase [Oscillospiraceae bacterium]|nr:aldo/keto reductase [Oscillospiraceae bacterium]
MTDLLKLPKLGFGFMRLPKKDGQIDLATLNDMVDEAMGSGVNFFDTAYVYHSGESEKALKAAVVDRYPRESYIVSDKIPAWEIESREDMDKLFATQLERTGLTYFDMYLIHSLEESHRNRHEDPALDFWGWGQGLKEKGLVRHFGFSFHDTPERLDEVLTAHPEVDFVFLQVNYLDWENPLVHAGKCCEIARKHGKPIIAMEPVRGGALASMKPEYEARLKALNPESSIASWAIRFCMSLDGVVTALSGMSAPDQVKDNISTMKNYAPFSEAEKSCLDQVTKELLAAPTIGCTTCGYCVDSCPANINIPSILTAYNTILTYGDYDRPHFYYRGLVQNGGAASSCIGCKKCEELCPQHLNITDALEKASAVFDVKK